MSKPRFDLTHVASASEKYQGIQSSSACKRRDERTRTGCTEREKGSGRKRRRTLSRIYVLPGEISRGRASAITMQGAVDERSRRRLNERMGPHLSRVPSFSPQRCRSWCVPRILRDTFVEDDSRRRLSSHSFPGRSRPKGTREGRGGWKTGEGRETKGVILGSSNLRTGLFIAPTGAGFTRSPITEIYCPSLPSPSPPPSPPPASHPAGSLFFFTSCAALSSLTSHRVLCLFFRDVFDEALR